MRKFLLWAAVACLAVVSCKKDDPEADAALNVTPASITAQKTPESGYELTINTNMAWTLSCNRSSEGWIAFDKSKGGPGVSTVTMTLTENASGAERTATVTVTAGGKTKNVSVVQSAADTEVSAHKDAEANEWMSAALSEYYLYCDEWDDIVAGRSSAVKLDFNMDYDKFLGAHLGKMTTNDRDGGYYSDRSRYIYSYVNRQAASRAANSFPATFGFEHLAILYADSQHTSYVFMVMDVMADSPAAKAGFRRGDFIAKVNGSALTNANYASSYYKLTSQASGTLTVTKYGESNPVSLTAVTNLPDTPIAHSSVITTAGGKKVGYLVYRHFVSGYTDFQTYEYDQELQRIFTGFKEQGIDEMVLDLRYNPGGNVPSCVKLASMIARSGVLNGSTVFCTNKRNDKVTRREGGDDVKMFDKDMAVYNIDRSKVYVIATEASASCSELLINGLRGVDVEVVHIGTVTEGKDVGMYGLTPKDNAPIGSYTYTFWPISFRSYNAKGESDYNDGFTPQYEIEELEFQNDVCDFGEKREPMLKVALDLIDGKTPTLRASSGTRSGNRFEVPGAEVRRVEVRDAGAKILLSDKER
ncbi:MAG: PDZ domain-containing protein [Rikenellaceae bacterium]|nr:PDZ domain-containing protein [Rikenellaceae bacterium]